MVRYIMRESIRRKQAVNACTDLFSLQNPKRADHLLIIENFRPNPAAVGEKEKESNFNQETFLQKGDGLDALEDEEPAASPSSTGISNMSRLMTS